MQACASETPLAIIDRGVSLGRAFLLSDTSSLREAKQGLLLNDFGCSKVLSRGA